MQETDQFIQFVILTMSYVYNFDIEYCIKILDHTHHIPTSSTQPISILTTTNSLCHYAASRYCNSNCSSFSRNFTNNRSR